jgi:hypothetical protein
LIIGILSDTHDNLRALEEARLLFHREGGGWLHGKARVALYDTTSGWAVIHGLSEGS